jgi:hypothetical protein
VQAVRDRQVPDLAHQAVDPVVRLDDVSVDQRANRLHREQRHALRLAGDLRPRGRRHPGYQRVHQAVHRDRIQRAEGQRDPVPAGAEPRPGLAELGTGEH